MVLAVLVVLVVVLGAKRWARSVLNTVAAHRPARPCSVHSSQLQRVGAATSLCNSSQRNFSAFCNPTELATSLQPNFYATQLLSATQLLCILQPKGARNFCATELVCNPTKLSRSSRAAQELPVESQKNLIFVIRFKWCLVSGISLNLISRNETLGK